MIRLALLGATGRMGGHVLELLGEDGRFELVAALTGPDDPRCGEAVRCGGREVVVRDSCDEAFDVLVDFSLPAGTMRWVEACVERSAAMVIGATGHSAEELARIERCAETIPILKAGNFSVGVNLLLGLVAEAAKKLGPDYDIEIVEHHHNKKIDAPSGTADALLRAIVDATGGDVARDAVYGRHGHTGVRPAGQIGVHAVRMGAIVGHHEVHFSGASESICIRHTAHSRGAFARGAVEAAAWVRGRPAGMYGMREVLGLGS